MHIGMMKDLSSNSKIFLSEIKIYICRTVSKFKYLPYMTKNKKTFITKLV